MYAQKQTINKGAYIINYSESICRLKNEKQVSHKLISYLHEVPITTLTTRPKCVQEG